MYAGQPQDLRRRDGDLHDTNLLTAKGNVTLTTLTERISAESLEFNLKTKLGVFHHASGSSQIEENPRKPKSQFGAQEVEVLFYGETIEKIGYRKYRITKGGFTTCVQANPRWMIMSSSVVVNVNHYAMLHNAVIKVKGVPVLYLPVVYYPINKDDRATGFLLPAYGTSSLRGQTLSNAFFWAFSRSQDATFMVDYFSKTGYGYGGEYRRVGAEGRTATFAIYRLHEKPVAYTEPSRRHASVGGWPPEFPVAGIGHSDPAARPERQSAARLLLECLGAADVQHRRPRRHDRTRVISAGASTATGVHTEQPPHSTEPRPSTTPRNRRSRVRLLGSRSRARNNRCSDRPSTSASAASTRTWSARRVVTAPTARARRLTRALARFDTYLTHPLPVYTVAVLYGQFVAWPGDSRAGIRVLTLRPAPRCWRRSIATTSTCRRVRRSGAQPCLEHTWGTVRREDQAHDRAVVRRSTIDRDRQLTARSSRSTAPTRSSEAPPSSSSA